MNGYRFVQLTAVRPVVTPLFLHAQQHRHLLPCASQHPDASLVAIALAHHRFPDLSVRNHDPLECSGVDVRGVHWGEEGKMRRGEGVQGGEEGGKVLDRRVQR